MNEPAILTPPPASTASRSRAVGEPSHALVDRSLIAVGGAAACVVGFVLVAVALSLFDLALPSIRAFGFGFASGQRWDPVHGDLGALPFLYGTIVTSLVALLLAVPVAVGVALFLTDLGPPILRRPVAALVGSIAPGEAPGVGSMASGAGAFSTTRALSPAASPARLLRRARS